MGRTAIAVALAPAGTRLDDLGAGLGKTRERVTHNLVHKQTQKLHGMRNFPLRVVHAFA